MKPNTVALLLSLLALPAFAADKLDPRLATASKAFVVAAEPLGDDRDVATCVAAHLATKTPLVLVSSADEADIILAVTRANIGLHPTAHLVVRQPDDVVLWETRTPRRGLAANWFHVDLACMLADELLGNVRDAMRKARDKK